jgi:VCBS repeat-containing protein
VFITVTPVNDAPVAVGETYTIDQDTTLNVAAPGVLANDSDGDGDSLHTVLGVNVAHGTLALAADGSFVYTPNASFAGDDSFTYRAHDGTVGSNLVTVTIHVLDTQPPSITASLAKSLLWPPDHVLIDVGLTYSATDNSSTPVTTVAVFSDEDDVTSAGGDRSPDAVGALQLRAERDARLDGRVYLIVITSTDAASNTSRKCLTAVVPKSMSAADVASVNAQALAAQTQCTGAGMFVVGD